MSPDPQAVREIAREAMHRGGSDSANSFIGSVISDHAAMNEILASGDRAAFGRLHAAVRAELKGATIAVSWPDEQQPADPVSGEQQDGAAGRVEAFLGLRERYENTPGIRLDTRDGSLAVLWDSERNDLTTADVRAVLAERDALAARVAELEGERAADTQAVAAALVAYIGRYVPDAMLKLYARFADRCAAQAGDETDGSGTDDVPCSWCHCDGCDECTGIHGVVCGCRNPVQR